MSIFLTPNTNAISRGMYTYFTAGGGTAPYVYSMANGGIGGTVNPSTGLYTAPSNLSGVDTVEVTDSLSNTAQASIIVGNSLELLCDIIQTEMGLSQGQVYLWDQKFNIPPDERLYVAVSVLSCKPFGNDTKFNGDGTATQSTNFFALVSIDLLSRGPEARDRKEEVVMALNSIYSQSQQEINSFNVGVIPRGFNNLSMIDGAAIPYRFHIQVGMQYMVRKTKAVPYYDTFSPVAVTVEPNVYPAVDDLTTEDGDHIITEDGDQIVLEPVA